MRTTYFLLLFFITTLFSISAQQLETFNEYFTDKTMRVDYHHTGDSKLEIVSLDQIYVYGIWAGSRTNLIDKFNIGRYRIQIYDASSGKLIYSRGFDSYFGEYKTSGAALDGVVKTFHETAIIPLTKNKILFSLAVRDKENNFNELFSTMIDPENVDIRYDDLNDPSVNVYDMESNGDPHNRVDVAIIAEGYTRMEKDKFLKDLAHFHDVFFNHEPYKSMKDKFNVYGVFKPSIESGVDEPRAGIFKNTVLNCTFNSLGSERYLLTEDNKSLRDIAANVPYDALYIMVNHKRYGGGGIYNFYCTFTSDTQWKDYIFLHEFGHSFAGLADEYYTSSTAYNDFYPRGIEPVEANITALLDPENIKWKHLLSAGIELPTLWEKADYDSMDYKWQKLRRELNNKTAELKKNKAPEEDVEKAEFNYALQDKLHSDKVDEYLMKSKFAGKVGAFEGAGYSSQGLYRPMIDCIMFSKGNKPFCKVCHIAIMGMIDTYTEK
ncbi:MAG: M64 family metallopeptidase [Ignavibacteria bacterium]|jgi:hypothetical protein